MVELFEEINEDNGPHCNENSYRISVDKKPAGCALQSKKACALLIATAAFYLPASLSDMDFNVKVVRNSA